MDLFFGAGILLGYLLGAIPSGYLMGKFLKGIDVREHGSGNPGATNVFRVVGKVPGVLSLLIDVLKGYLPVKAALAFPMEKMPFSHPWMESGFAPLVGLAAIAGHNWTLFLNFKGGKGVATSTGVFLALLPLPTGIAFLVFVIVFLLTRTVSLGSLAGSTSLPLAAWFLEGRTGLTLLSALCTLVIFFLHKKNIKRLLNHEEPKISFTKEN